MSDTIKQEDIFGPMLALMALTILVSMVMTSRRLPFILGYLEKHKEITPEDMDPPTSRHYLNRVSPPAVLNPSNNLKNLFEFPVLFYALIGYLYATQSVDVWYVQAAWMYVVFRTLHSAVHCTINIVKMRFACFLSSLTVLMVMVGRAAMQHFARTG